MDNNLNNYDSTLDQQNRYYLKDTSKYPLNYHLNSLHQNSQLNNNTFENFQYLNEVKREQSIDRIRNQFSNTTPLAYDTTNWCYFEPHGNSLFQYNNSLIADNQCQVTNSETYMQNHYFLNNTERGINTIFAKRYILYK